MRLACLPPPVPEEPMEGGPPLSPEQEKEIPQDPEAVPPPSEQQR